MGRGRLLEGHEHRARGGVARLTVLRECAFENGNHGRRDSTGQGATEGSGLVDVLEDRAEGGRRLEGADAREELVGQNPEAVDVAAEVDALAPCLLGAHVVGRTDDVPCAGRSRVALGAPLLGDSEIHQLRDAAAVEHNVRRLQVAVDHADLVDRFESFRDLFRQAERLARRQSAAAQEVLQVVTLDELHADVVDGAVLPVLVDAADVAVGDLAGELDLRSKATPPFSRGLQLHAEDLDRHVFVEHPVVGPVHGAHPALAQGLGNLVAARDQGALTDRRGQSEGEAA